MKLKTQIIITFLVGFTACAITGGAPIVLLILMTLLAAGSLACMRLDIKIKWPETKLARLWRFSENSEASQSPRETFVLGVGHHVSR